MWVLKQPLSKCHYLLPFSEVPLDSYIVLSSMVSTCGSNDNDDNNDDDDGDDNKGGDVQEKETAVIVQPPKKKKNLLQQAMIPVSLMEGTSVVYEHHVFISHSEGCLGA